jgi:hypothetical protein
MRILRKNKRREKTRAGLRGLIAVEDRESRETGVKTTENRMKTGE